MRCLRIAMLCLAATQLPAQSSPANGPPHDQPPIGLWGSLTLGPGRSSNEPRTLVGAQAAVFGSFGHWIAGARRGGASGIDSGGSYDDALLAGWRGTAPYFTLFAVAGPAQIFDESTGVARAALGFAVEAGGNARIIGLGLSTVGAWRPGLSYIAVGLTLDAGWIR